MPGLTLQQLQQMGATPVNPAPIQPTAQGLTLAQLQQMGGTPAQPIDKSTGQPLDALSNAVQSSIKGAFNSGVQQTKEGFQQAQNAKNPLELVEGGLKTAAGAANTIFSPLAPLTAPLNKGINKSVDELSNIPAVQKFAQTGAGQTTQRIAEDVANASTIAGTVAGLGNTKELSNVASNASDTVSNAVKNEISDIIPKTGEASRNIIGEQFRKTAEQYTRPGGLLSEAENKHGTNPIGVLESYGNSVIPKLENGKITAQSIEEPTAVLEEGIKKLSNLKNDAVFLNDNTIKPSEYIQYIKDTAQAQASKGWSKMKINDAITAINKFANKLNETYPNDTPIKVNELDQFKTEQTGLSKSYKNLSAKPFELDAHGIIGSASRDLVEKLTDDAPTKEINKLIQSHYDAIDLLDSLVGKTPHGGRFTQVAEMMGGTVVGAMAGLGAGHPFLGAMFGRAGAHVMDSLLRSNFISDPIKRMLIQDIGIKDPAIIKQMNDYITANSPDISELGDKSLPTQNLTNKQGK